MKNHEDLAHGWWRKGDSDLANAQMCLDAGRALDTACFHAQQATVMRNFIMVKLPEAFRMSCTT